MSADGSNQQRLTRNKLDEYALDWSQSGQLAFVRAGEVFVMKPDGSGLQRLTRNHMREDAIAWSPDGQEIAFVRWRTGGRSSSIFVMNANGSTERRLTPPSLWYDGLGNVPYPVWSPDAKQIAFQWGKYLYLYVMNADGSGRRKVARGGTPTWSPDGGRIAFSGPAPAIYVVNSDGSGQRRLVPRPGRRLSWRRANGSPAWSPTR
jgi:Tol biopolymer transport system component